MNDVNKDIKTAAFCKGVKLWQIAQKLNVGEATLSRWLRVELSPEKKERIFAIIEEIYAENA